MEKLRYPDAWYGSDSDVKRAMQIFNTFIGELGTMISKCSDTTSNGCHDAPDCDQTTEYSGGDDMSNPCLPVKIENGDLYYWNKCEWVKVGNVSGDDSGHDIMPPVESETPEEAADFRCIKATVIGNLIWKVAEAIFTVIEDTPPWDFADAVEEIAGIQLDSPGLIGAWGSYWTYKIVLVDHYDTSFGELQKADFICHFAPVADGTTTSISEREMDRIHAVMAQVLGVDIVSTAFFENVILAINKGRFERAVKLAVAAGFTYDCPCLEPEDIPVEHTWSKVFDFTKGNYGMTRNGAQNACQYVASEGWVCAALDGGGANVPTFGRVGGADNAELCHITYVKIHVKSWPDSLVVGGGQPSFFRNGNAFVPGASGEQFRGQENLIQVVNTSHNISTRLEWGWDEWFTGAGNSAFRSVIDKVVIAGDGGDMWSKVNPDGSWD
jgi:hypothetical protein